MAAPSRSRLRLAHHGLFRRGLGDEAREHRRGLLPVEFGVVVLVQEEQTHHGGRDMRQPPDLARGRWGDRCAARPPPARALSPG